MENTDPRYVRSRLAFRQAVVELAREDVTRVSVSLVCERTNIDRATFYRHFTDIDSLVTDTITSLAAEAAQDWESTTQHTGDQDESAVVVLTGYLAHIADNWTLYRWALGRAGFARAIHGVLENFSATIAGELTGLPHTVGDEELRRYSAYFAGGVLGVCLSWLENETPVGSPAELARWTLTVAPRLTPAAATAE